jgi:hypothetical protein
MGRHGSFQKSGWSKKGDEYEAKRQNEPVEGCSEEKKCQEKPEKIAGREEISIRGIETRTIKNAPVRQPRRPAGAFYSDSNSPSHSGGQFNLYWLPSADSNHGPDG